GVGSIRHTGDKSGSATPRPAARSVNRPSSMPRFLAEWRNPRVRRVSIFKRQTPEIIPRGLVADLLERNIDAAVQNRAGNRHKNAEFFPREDDAKTIGDVGNQPDHPSALMKNDRLGLV